MKTSHKLILGDSRRMTELADESVHLVVTSPPYWQLKDYGTETQIGFNQTYEEYINHLNLVWNECHRVLHKGCRLCVNIGDQFARSAFYGRYKVIPIRTEIIKFCENVGLDYMGAIIWQKVTTTNTTGGGTIMGSFPYPRNGILKLDYEFILIFKRPGKPPQVDQAIKDQSKLSLEDWNRYFSGHWKFGGVKQIDHIARFPEELPYRMIRMFTFVGDTVLDPFLGSGTTSAAAKKLFRNSVGYEINPEFMKTIEQAIRALKDSREVNSEVISVRQQKASIDYNKEIRALPYVFQDSLEIDKKVDPRQKSFGSKINQASKKREEYYTVRDVRSAKTLTLSDDSKIRLIGIKEHKINNGRAIEFLRQKLQNERVYLRFDTTRFDGNQNLLCYLYLKNRTFVNSLLIRKGLADVDISFDYKHKQRFLIYKERAACKQNPAQS